MNKASKRYYDRPDEEAEASEVFYKTVVPPDTTVDLIAGIYEDGLPQPHLSLEPNSGRRDQVSASMERREEFGDYWIIYHVRNRSRHPVRVMLRDGGTANGNCRLV